MLFAKPPFQNEISAFSCSHAPPCWLPVMKLGPKPLPNCARAPPRKSIPKPEFDPGPNVLPAMVVRPYVLKFPWLDHRPEPPLLLMSRVPPDAYAVTTEFSKIPIPA